MDAETMLATVRRVIVARIDWMREEGEYDMRSIRWFVESLSSAADVLEEVRELDGCDTREGQFLTRIASDARVLKERDARIAEVETQLQRALDGAVFHEKRAHHAEQERDAARVRIAELEQLLQDQPRLLYDSMWQAIDRMGDAVGTLTGPGSNCHVTATRVCETIETLKSERDAALRALELANDNTRLWRERTNGLGASTTEKGHVERSSTAAPAHHTTSQGAGLGKDEPAPTRQEPQGSAPIPIGAAVDWDHVQEVRDFVMRGLSKARECCVSCENHEKAWIRTLDTLLANRHPVATRETVERVRKALLQAFRATRVGEDFTENYTRAALTAAGITLEAGA